MNAPVCDKAAGMTLGDVVARVRRLAGQRRVGHGGTLDPPATGVLVLALASHPAAAVPAHRAQALPGRRRLRGRDRHPGRRRHRHRHRRRLGVEAAGLRAAMAGFVGPQEQVLPMVSAIKVGGERLYAKACRGEQVERAPCPIVVHALELLGFNGGERPLATVEVVCLGGTYVRSLAADPLAGTLAHLASLRRTAVGRFQRGRGPPPGGPRRRGSWPRPCSTRRRRWTRRRSGP